MVPVWLNNARSVCGVLGCDWPEEGESAGSDEDGRFPVPRIVTVGEPRIARGLAAMSGPFVFWRASRR